MKNIFFVSTLILLSACASKVQYSGDHGGQLYTEGNISVEIVEKKDKTLDVYFYKRNQLIPVNKVSLKNASVESITEKPESISFKKEKTHFKSLKKIDLEDSEGLLNFQMSEGNTTHRFTIPL